SRASGWRAFSGCPQHFSGGRIQLVLAVAVVDNEQSRVQSLDVIVRRPNK
ncbi:hypothetical protein BIW11_10045, partial [Tropilaelaps mercedesae]